MDCTKFALALATAAALEAGAATYRVTADAAGGGDGLSWASPMTLAEAKSAVAAGGEIWLRADTFLPDSSLFSTAWKTTGAVTVRGGFAGTEASIDDRPASAMTTIDGQETARTFHVQNTAQVTVERVAFTRAYVSAFYKTSGNGSVTLDSCRFFGNSGGTAPDSGLGIAVSLNNSSQNYSVVVTNCVFEGNRFSKANTAGVLYAFKARSLAIVGCTFLTNGLTPSAASTFTTGVKTSAARAASCTNVRVAGCRFIGNASGYMNTSTSDTTKSDFGSTLHLGATSASVTNCLFLANQVILPNCNDAQSPRNSGVLYSLSGALSVANCTFAFNLADGIDNAAGLLVHSGAADVRSCVFSGNVTNSLRRATANGRDLHVRSGASAAVSWSMFDDNSAACLSSADGGLSMGAGNLFADPLFVCGGAGAAPSVVKVKNAIDRIVWHENDLPSLAALDVHLGPRSPAIDAGDPAADWTAEPSPNGRRANMGFYGGTPWAEPTAAAHTVILLR